MSKNHYKHSGPLEIDKGKYREYYVKSCSTWTFTDIWEYSDILKLQKGDDPLWNNCLKNLGIALQLKEESDREYIDFLEAHLYEKFDLTQ